MCVCGGRGHLLIRTPPSSPLSLASARRNEMERHREVEKDQKAQKVAKTARNVSPEPGGGNFGTKVEVPSFRPHTRPNPAAAAAARLSFPCLDSSLIPAGMEPLARRQVFAHQAIPHPYFGLVYQFHCCTSAA